MLNYIAMGATLAIAAAVQPGPLQTYIISQSLSRGWRRTLPAAFAPLLSDAPIIALVLLILSAIPQGFVRFLHFAGALFIFYLAYTTYITWRNYENRTQEHQEKEQTLLKAVTVNLLNPAPYLAWSFVMGPIFLRGYRETPANGIALLVGFYTTIVICQMNIIFVFAFARKLGPRINRILLGISIIGLFGFGVYQLWMGFNA